MGAGGSVQVENRQTSAVISWESHPKTYIVSLVTSEGFKLSCELPPKFILHINYESLDFVRIEPKGPIIQFPFQNIICWGSNSTVFRFNIFDYENVGKDDISIILKTTQGRIIEEVTMGTVRKLMADMEKKAISKEEFQELIPLIIDIDNNSLKDNWMKTISQFSSGRTFLAKQCMDLIFFISPLAPFEKFDLACLLYTRVLSKDSFQLVVNTFDDEIERDNLLHRLGLDKDNNNNNNNSHNHPNSKNGQNNGTNIKIVTNCKILPSSPKNALASQKAYHQSLQQQQIQELEDTATSQRIIEESSSFKKNNKSKSTEDEKEDDEEEGGGGGVNGYHSTESTTPTPATTVVSTTSEYKD